MTSPQPVSPATIGEAILSELAHDINPVIGWLRNDIHRATHADPLTVATGADGLIDVNGMPETITVSTRTLITIVQRLSAVRDTLDTLPQRYPHLTSTEGTPVTQAPLTPEQHRSRERVYMQQIAAALAVGEQPIRTTLTDGDWADIPGLAFPDFEGTVEFGVWSDWEDTDSGDRHPVYLVPAGQPDSFPRLPDGYDDGDAEKAATLIRDWVATNVTPRLGQSTDA